MRRMSLFLLLTFSWPSCTVVSASTSGLPVCPPASAGLRSRGSDEALTVEFRNKAEVTLIGFWVDYEGIEQPEFTLSAGTSATRNTFNGHAFRFYVQTTSGKKTLVREHIVGERESKVDIALCGAAKVATVGDSLRSREFSSLVHASDKACEGHSRSWSCVRKVPKKECEVRSKKEFGLSKKHAKAHGFGAGQTEDFRHDYQIDHVPRVADGPGYLVMNMTSALKEIVSWYDQESKRTAAPAGEVPGGYLDAGAGTWRVNLDIFSDKKRIVMSEMKDVLEWWTHQGLVHTSTYGIRIYGRNAVLLNHVDRHDTHVASAVLQIGQEISESGAGWPLEIISKERDCYEVYLQPGQMVLYEGARFKHGRPMRFRGDQFANIFTHFKPKDYTGIRHTDL